MLNQSINNKNMVSHANMSRLLKQMSLIVSTELQQIAIDLVERLDEDKLVKFIRLKEEFRHTGMNIQNHQMSHHQSQMTQKYSSIANKVSSSNSNSQTAILLKQQQRQINNQLRNLPNQMSQMSFTKQIDTSNQRDYLTNNSGSSRSTTPTIKPSNIFNPYKAMSQYKTDEKVMNLALSFHHALPDRRQENLI